MSKGQLYFFALMFLHSLVCTFFQHERRIYHNSLICKNKIIIVKLNKTNCINNSDKNNNQNP